MNNFIRTIRLIKFKRVIRWTAIILATLALGIMLVLSAYAIASRYDSTLRGIEIQNPIQSPLKFKEQETTVKAPRNAKTTPVVVQEASSEHILANAPKDQ